MKCPYCNIHNVPDETRNMTKEEIKSQCVEHHRKVYEEKALPFLRLEKPTPLEIEKQVDELRNEVKELKRRLETKK